VIEAAAAAAKSTSAWDQPGTLAFLVIFGMGVVLYFVFRSLARQLRKVNEAARLEALQAEALQAEGSQAGGMQAESTSAESISPESIPAESIPAEALQDQGSPARGSLGQGLPPTS
jgi:hypothetical protein